MAFGLATTECQHFIFTKDTIMNGRDLLRAGFVEFFRNHCGGNHAAFREDSLPHTALITCCDPRINLMRMFSGDTGDFFVIPTIAALIPAHTSQAALAISASLEHAIVTLKVSSIVILGHRGCIGARRLVNILAGRIPLEEQTSNLHGWLLQAKDAVEAEGDVEGSLVVYSASNLAEYPIIERGLKDGSLTLDGWVCDPSTGDLISICEWENEE